VGRGKYRFHGRLMPGGGITNRFDGAEQLPPGTLMICAVAVEYGIKSRGIDNIVQRRRRGNGRGGNSRRDCRKRIFRRPVLRARLGPAQIRNATN